MRPLDPEGRAGAIGTVRAYPNRARSQRRQGNHTPGGGQTNKGIVRGRLRIACGRFRGPPVESHAHAFVRQLWTSDGANSRSRKGWLLSGWSATQDRETEREDGKSRRRLKTGPIRHLRQRRRCRSEHGASVRSFTGCRRRTGVDAWLPSERALPGSLFGLGGPPRLGEQACGVPRRAVRFSEVRVWFVAGVIPIG